MKTFLQFLFPSIVLLILTFPTTYGQGTVETRSFNSPTLGVTKYYKIYLPAEYYQSTDSYPVVYFYRNHENEWFSYGSLNQIADDLTEAGLIGKMILVGPNSGSNNGNYAGCVNMLRPDLAPAYGIGTGMFEDYIVNDLITHIDTTYRTIADKQHRGIDGFSLGGFISTVTSLHNPEVFSSIGSFDGTLMYHNLDDPGVPGPGPDDGFWMIEPLADPIFDVPRNVPYMLEQSVTNILESADTSLLNQFKTNRYHISESYCGGAGNYWRNKNFVEKLREKGIPNSWGNPLIHENATHLYTIADVHATASLVKHWQTFNGTKISAPSLIDFSITELTGKNREVVVFNYGPGSLTINDVQITSSEFSVVNLPSLPVVVQPMTDSLVFNINFLPTSYQSFADTTYIYSDDLVTPVVKIILRGKGGSFKAEPEVLYASTLTGLFTIRPDSLVVSSIGPYGTDINYVKELNVDPATKELYVFGNYWSSFYELDKVNTRGGDGFWFQYFDCSTSSITTAEIGSDTLLYIGSSNGSIYTIDYRFPYILPSVNQIAATGLSLTAFSFSPVDGQLWAAVGTNEIYMIDINTGNTALIGSTGLNKSIDDITFDYEGILYGLVGSGSGMDTLVTINTSTGIATKLGSLNTTALNAIAISPEEPNGIIATHNILPQNYYLSQNFPNPFNPTTTIKYSIPKLSFITIKIYDVLGSEVATLINEENEIGNFEVEFNAATLPSGVYFYQLKATPSGGQAGFPSTGSGQVFVETKKMLLLK